MRSRRGCRPRARSRIFWNACADARPARASSSRSIMCRRTLSTWIGADASRRRSPAGVSAASITRRSLSEPRRSTRPARTSPSSRRVSPLGESCSLDRQVAHPQRLLGCLGQEHQHLVVAEVEPGRREVAPRAPSSGRRRSRRSCARRASRRGQPAGAMAAGERASVDMPTLYAHGGTVAFASISLLRCSQLFSSERNVEVPAMPLPEIPAGTWTVDPVHSRSASSPAT